MCLVVIFFLQAAVFHALGLAPITQSFFGGYLPVPLDTRRVVLLVPKSGLRLLRAFASPEIYLALAGTVQTFDNHFASVHSAFVKVRRGRSYAEDYHSGWRSLTNHLAVRDARGDDPDAELMVSALVPTFALLMAPPESTELQLRPRDSAEMFAAPKDIMKKLGGQLSKVFYKADLANIDRTAVLTPGATASFVQGEASCPSFSCPEEVVTGRPDNQSPRPGRSSSLSAIQRRFMYGDAAVDQSIELIDPSGGRELVRPVYRATLKMASTEAREALAAGGAPVVENTLDPCTIRLKLWEGTSHVTSFPFPVQQGSMSMKFSKRQGFVLFTVPPQSSTQPQPSFAWAAYDVQGVGQRVLPSMLSWSPSPPLSSLPRLDFKAEWAHDKVRSVFSQSARKRPSRNTTLPRLDSHGLVDSRKEDRVCYPEGTEMRV